MHVHVKHQDAIVVTRVDAACFGICLVNAEAGCGKIQMSVMTYGFETHNRRFIVLQPRALSSCGEVMHWTVHACDSVFSTLCCSLNSHNALSDP